jgi:type I restriction enzyme S subunit
MPNETWSKLPFDEAVQVNPSVRLDKGTVYPFVEMAAVDPASRIVRESERRAFKSGGAKFQPGDTLMARITPCLENGKIARFQPSDGTSKGFGSTEFIVVRGRDGVTNNDFAYYLTKWPEFRQYAIAQMTGSSGRQRVPAGSLSHFEVTVPPVELQKRIASVLGSLDDKIEANRRMNRTLERMAQALFKSWFIDFDPVHAKAEGRDPNLPADIADLFPGSFDDSELGPIPKG